MQNLFVEYSVARFLEALYKIDYPCGYRASSILGIDYKVFQRRLMKVEEAGFRLRMSIDISRIFLRKVFVFSDSEITHDWIPFLRLEARMLPRGTYMVFFMPFGLNHTLFLSRINVSFRDVYVSSIDVYPQPKFTVYRVEGDLMPNVWARLLLKRLDSATPIPANMNSREKQLVLKSLYLKILKELELKPFHPHYELANKLGVRPKDVKKAIDFFYSHKVFKGVCVRRMPWYKLNDLGLIAIVSDLKENDARLLLGLFLEYPMFAGGSLLADGSVLLTFAMPGKYLTDVEKSLSDVVKTLGGSIIARYTVLSYDAKRYTIPFIDGKEYDKYRKYWNITLEDWSSQ
ncbi:hypothetical protein J4526_06465 [Desulfurococcaceae archaeon MEX13E-LK6-19]|nr:hypothetical protein J4526_06465 [Desulfurococcaceae archaeon MEX13E-LK6-19]